MDKFDKNGNSVIKAKFRQCTENDFTSKNFNMHSYKEEHINRLCPEISDDIKEYYKVQNLERNATSRTSFSVEIEECNYDI